MLSIIQYITDSLWITSAKDTTPIIKDNATWKCEGEKCKNSMPNHRPCLESNLCDDCYYHIEPLKQNKNHQKIHPKIHPKKQKEINTRRKNNIKFKVLNDIFGNNNTRKRLKSNTQNRNIYKNIQYQQKMFLKRSNKSNRSRGNYNNTTQRYH